MKPHKLFPGNSSTDSSVQSDTPEDAGNELTAGSTVQTERHLGAAKPLLCVCRVRLHLGRAFPQRWRFFLAWIGGLVLWAVAGGAAQGVEFRVENSVYVDNSSQPVAESVTLFINNRMYDFLTQPEEIVIFDPIIRHFVLLYPPMQLRTDLRVEQVAAFISTLRSWAGKHQDPFIRFSANPDVHVDESTGGPSIVFDSQFLRYIVDVDRPPDPQIARIYADFSDWYLQLNTMVVPGSRLPFARLHVNKVLLERQLVPLRVELRLKPEARPKGQPQLIRSYHNFFYRVSEADRNRAAQADQFAQIYRSVSFVEYQQQLRKALRK